MGLEYGDCRRCERRTLANRNLRNGDGHRDNEPRCAVCGAFLRPDEVVNPHGDEPLLANAPARDGRLFRVPRIIE